MKDLFIIGASGHGKVVADIAERIGYSNIFFLDDNVELKSCAKYSVVGTSKDTIKYKNADFFVAIGDSVMRKKIYFELVNNGVHVISLVHPTAIVASDVKIGLGSVIMAGAVINSSSIIGQGCIVNTCASVDHDCVLGDFVHVSVGAHLAGNVVVGNNVFVGAGATVINNIDISADCLIGAGGVVVDDINETGLYVGVPAKKKVKER